MFQLNEILKKNHPKELSVTDNLCGLAEIFGADFVFGTTAEVRDSEGRLTHTVVRRPMSLASAHVLIDYLERKRKREEKEMEKAKRKK